MTADNIVRYKDSSFTTTLFAFSLTCTEYPLSMGSYVETNSASPADTIYSSFGPQGRARLLNFSYFSTKHAKPGSLGAQESEV